MPSNVDVFQFIFHKVKLSHLDLNVFATFTWNTFIIMLSINDVLNSKFEKSENYYLILALKILNIYNNIILHLVQNLFGIWYIFFISFLSVFENF